MRVRLRLKVPRPDETTPRRTAVGDVDLVLEADGHVFLHHPGEQFTKSESLRVDGRIQVEIVDVSTET